MGDRLLLGNIISKDSRIENNTSNAATVTGTAAATTVTSNTMGAVAKAVPTLHLICCGGAAPTAPP